MDPRGEDSKGWLEMWKWGTVTYGRAFKIPAPGMDCIFL